MRPLIEEIIISEINHNTVIMAMYRTVVNRPVSHDIQHFTTEVVVYHYKHAMKLNLYALYVVSVGVIDGWPSHLVLPCLSRIWLKIPLLYQPHWRNNTRYWLKRLKKSKGSCQKASPVDHKCLRRVSLTERRFTQKGAGHEMSQSISCLLL